MKYTTKQVYCFVDSLGIHDSHRFFFSSLGGALATVFAVKLAGSGSSFDHIPRPVTCITWAAPHQGTPAYRKAVEVRKLTDVALRSTICALPEINALRFFFFSSPIDLAFGTARIPSIAAHH